MKTLRVRTFVRILIANTFAICLSVGDPAAAQTYEVVYPFTIARGNPAAEMLLAPDGRLYGVASTGGRFSLGSIFSLTPEGGGGYTYAELHAFSGPDGIGPGSLALGPNGELYGTTNQGGAHELGTVFVMDLAGRLTTIHDFSGTGDDGYSANGQLVRGPDGLLYGTSPRGGQLNFGCVFRIDADDHVTTIYSFTAVEGDNPIAGLALGPDGGLYGTAYYGGSSNEGVVFRVTVDGSYSVLANFDVTNGSHPGSQLLLASDGFFYGTTWAGGQNNQGVLFRVGTSGGLVVAHHFGGTDGSGTQRALIQASDGRIYGAGEGGDGYGTVFAFDPSTDDFENFHDFTQSEGFGPVAGLVELPDGRLAGALAYGGPGLGSSGSLYALDSLSAFSLLWDFPGLGPAFPYSGLMEGPDQNLYGTTAGGGTVDDFGTVFRCSFSGHVTTLHSFSFDDGYYSPGRLLRAADGSLYGVTDGNGFRNGNVFRLAANGVFTVLHSFTGTTGAAPASGLIDGGDGNYYGTTPSGAAGFGVVYRITFADSFEGVHAFLGTDGSGPQGSLLLGSDGQLYGTAVSFLGAFGSVFRMDLAGNVTTIHAFQNTDGSAPSAELIEPEAGTLYGTTAAGGASQLGTVFRMDFAGQTTTLHEFSGADGAQPVTGLVEGADGAFYGSTAAGGAGQAGTLFKITSDGTFTTLHEFTNSGGTSPRGTLVRASDGNFYGVAMSSGAGNGVLFRLAMDSPEPSLDAISPTSGRSAGAGALSLSGAHLQPEAAVTIGGALALGIVAVDMTSMRLQSPALDPGTLNDVVVTNPDSTTATLTGGWFADFLDVAGVHLFHDSVESIFRAGITAGCDPGLYCPDADVTREQMAVFLLKAKHGSNYDPPACTGVFADVLCTPGEGFPDWIEQLYAEGVTGGCVANPLQYCPTRAVTRAEMAVFLLKTKYGTGFTPPACAGVFADVPCPATPEFPFSDWVEQLYTEQVTGGCATGPLRYCPDAANLRGEMAVFLTKTFFLP